MKKVLLSMVALLMSTFTFAQVNGALKLERNAAPAKMAVKASPRKALADGQRYLGYYSSDNFGQSGLGIAPLGAYETCKAVTAMSTDFLKPFVGMKVVGIRYAVLASNLVSKVMLGDCEFTSQGVGFGDDFLLSKDVTSSNAGWNTVMFDAPYTIPANTALYAGFQYNQKAVKQGSGFTDECYPLSLIKEGVTGNPLYIYTNVPANKGGNGEGWYNFGDEFGNICIQLIVEGQPAGNFLTPVQLDEFQTVVGKSKNVEVLFQNVCKSALSSYSYTYTQNGVTSAEQSVDLAANTTETIVKLPVQIEGAAAAGKYDFTLNITKVNYGENAAAVTSIKSKNETMAKELKPVVLMEEFTGTGCGWCPRGMQGMKNAAEKFGDQFVGIAIHQYSGSDPMYTINYANLKFGGAPSCKLNRATGDLDPYMGSGEDICDDIAEFLKWIPDAALTVKAEWGAADDGKLTATATVEAQAAKTYQLAFAVIADNVKGENDNWIQSNYYSSAYSSQTGMTYASIPDDLKFLWNEYPYKPVFNDVLVASSYVRTLNKCANVDVPAEGTVEGSYEITMPVTNTKLLPALDKDQLYIVGIIIDPTTKTVVNAAKAKIPTWVTGINGVKANGENAVEVARYTMDGRQVSAPVKGINLVKMSDGTTQKVLVK